MKKSFSLLLNRKNILAILLLCGMVFLLYSSALNNDFVNWDDDAHVTENPFVRDFNLQTIFTTTVNKIYIPLTTLSFSVENYLFGFNPKVYHLTNVLLHVSIVGLVCLFGLFLGLSLRVSVVAAFIFGVHPMHVESVAWITERKDVLYGFFYMWALVVYCRYIFEEKFKKRIGLFTLVILLGFLSLLSKPMALSLVFILWLCDWYLKRPRSREGLYSKGVLVFLSLPIVWMSYFFHMRTQAIDFPYSVLLWTRCFTFHIQKFFWPDYFALTYDIPLIGELIFPELIFSFAGAIVILLLIVIFRKYRLFVFAVLFYFLSTFFLYRLDTQADFNVVADRFMYLPSVGFCFLIGDIYEKAFLRIRNNRAFQHLFFIVIAGSIFILCQKTVRQINVWQNGETLWSHQLKVEPHTAPALVLNRLADAKMEQGRFDQNVFRLLEQSLSIKPDYSEAHYNLGGFYKRTNQIDKALMQFAKTVELNPDNFNAFVDMALIYQSQNQHQKAIWYFDRALVLQSDNKQLQLRILQNYKEKLDLDAYVKPYKSLLHKYSGKALF